jgi:hypothetical protein
MYFGSFFPMTPIVKRGIDLRSMPMLPDSEVFADSGLRYSRAAARSARPAYTVARWRR